MSWLITWEEGAENSHDLRGQVDTCEKPSGCERVRSWVEPSGPRLKAPAFMLLFNDAGGPDHIRPPTCDLWLKS